MRFPNPWVDDTDRDPPMSSLWTVAGATAGALVGVGLLAIGWRLLREGIVEYVANKRGEQ